MEYERACGAVVFTRKDGEIRYVIIQSMEGFYGFPKGHVEGHETETETVLREIHEETGLKPDIVDGFRTSDEYIIPDKNGIMKQDIYYLAEFESQEIHYQKEELAGATLMSFEEAMKVFQFESSKRILREAQDFLDKF